MKQQFSRGLMLCAGLLAMGAADPQVPYWGPPSFAWTGTDLFTAQNVGQSYIGALPLLLLVWGAVRGHLWAREVRFFTAALVVMMLYGLGWYSPFFRLAYEVVPGVSFYRRPADAVFLIGGLGSIVAGYSLHRLLASPYGERSYASAAATAGVIVTLLGLCLAVAWRLDRVGSAVAPLLMALGSFAVVMAAVAGASTFRHIRPIAALALLGGVTAADLAWNNGPNGASGLPPDMVEMLEPGTKNGDILRGPPLSRSA